MKNKHLPFLFLTFSCLSLSFLGNVHQDYQSAKAEELHLQSDGDAFTLLDKSFTSEESFVYTANLHFNNGQAGGLAFGSSENEHYYVLNMDRYENHVKLLYFVSNGMGGYNATELRTDYFLGNDKITEHELSYVGPKVRGIENVNLKVILTVEDTHAYAEFYVEGIKRFGINSIIDLNDLETSYKYEGGYLGMNCFNGDVYLSDIEIGKSDYSYFSEPYRNQYHLQPFAKWSNDPNALCYYNGYYHVFYQTHPFGLLWGDMFWGHARSRDLIHFEFLPICLFPDNESMGFGPGLGFMWSGCAITYQSGMIDDIDSKDWFPEGSGNGLLAIFTRDGGRQDQVLMSSDDEGLTWTKRIRIPQSISGVTDRKIDFRDPKVFPLVKDSLGKVTLWGMTLSSYGLNKGWFFKSTNLIDWSSAGSFNFPTPECIGVGFLEVELGNTKAYLSNKSRTYILGDLSYNSLTGKVEFIDENGVDISTYSLEDMPLRPLDFGPDTYASQSFYISDSTSDYYGKELVLNWFSGDLNASYCTGPGEYAGLRKTWNGGFTIPVMYGLKTTSDGYRLSQTPITIDNEHLEKKSIVNISNLDLSSDSDNPLKDVHTHIFELDASIKTEDNSSITFKVDVGEDEYMELGWNENDGYYVDRTHLDDKGINTNVDWHKKYVSNIVGDSDVKTFYVLSDNGGLEVFCEDYSISFYFVTTASIYSTGASLKSNNAHINYLKLNEIKSAYRAISGDEGVLYVSSENVELDTNFAKEKFVTAWFSGSATLNWEEIANDEVVSYVTSEQGIKFVALKAGSASFKVSVGTQEKIINVTVYDGSFDSIFTFKKENIVSGSWIMSTNAIIGTSNGDAFLLAKESGKNFSYSGTFDISSANAGALVFRASSDMSTFLVANYDKNEKIVKLWSSHGELTRSGILDISSNEITLMVKASGKNLSITINGINAIDYELNDDEPLEGKFGLNVFSGTVRFKSLALINDYYDYQQGNLNIPLENGQFVYEIYNVTLGNIRLEPGYYSQQNGDLYINELYLSQLNVGLYEFRIITSTYTFVIKVDVNSNSQIPHIDDIITEPFVNIVIYIGSLDVTSISINDELIDNSQYQINNYCLIISSSCFEEGDNNVLINDSISFTVTVNNLNDTVIKKHTEKDFKPLIISIAISSGALIGAAIIATTLIVIKRKRK